jgi:predicted secreted protein
MGITTAIAIYFLIWWIVLFAVLPWGVRAQDAADATPGTDPGAPAVPRLVAKLAWTTLVATVMWAISAVVYTKGWVTLDDLAGWLWMPKK